MEEGRFDESVQEVPEDGQEEDRSEDVDHAMRELEPSADNEDGMCCGSRDGCPRSFELQEMSQTNRAKIASRARVFVSAWRFSSEMAFSF